MSKPSTSEVYGTAQYVPIDEKHALQPQSPYSATKIASDCIALSFHYSFGFPVVVARPFNTYGPRQSARAVIPSIVVQIAEGKSSIFLGNLTATRDFTYVEDTCRGFLAIAQMEKGEGEIFHIGSNDEIAVGDLVELIGEIMGRTVQVVSAPERFRPEKSEVQRLKCDNSKLKNACGFTPRISLREGLERTAKWFSQPENLRRYKGDLYNVYARSDFSWRQRESTPSLYTVVLPKPLMPIGEFSILEIILRQLAANGFDRVTLAVNYQAEIVRAFCGDGSRWGIGIDYSLEPVPLSTIGPLCLIDDLPENFLLMNGDVLTDLPVKKLYEEHVSHERQFTIAASERTNIVDYGVLHTNENQLVGFEEKPKLQYLVSMGIYVMNRSLLRARACRAEVRLRTTLMLDMLARKEPVHVERYPGYWLDIGRVDDYMRAVEEFDERRKQLLPDEK